MVSRTDILLAIQFVQFPDERLVDLWEIVGVIDDAGIRCPFYIIHISFIHGPGIEESLRTIFVIDGAIVESIDLCLQVGESGSYPFFPGSL